MTDYERGRREERADVARRTMDLHHLATSLEEREIAAMLLKMVAEFRMDYHVGAVARYDEANGPGASDRDIREKTDDIVARWAAEEECPDDPV